MDTPGHTSAISRKAYSEHIARADAKPRLTYANEPPASQLHLASPATIDFTASLLSAAAKLFPSTLFATGGNEINTRCYQDDPQTQQDLAGRTLNEALEAFTQATHGAPRSLGRTPIVWRGDLDILWVHWWDSQFFFGFCTEILLNFNQTLSNDRIALCVSTFFLSHTPSRMLMCIDRVWISSDDAATVAAKDSALSTQQLIRSIWYGHESALYPCNSYKPQRHIGLWCWRLVG
jgi:hypothetical protein